MLEVSSAVIVMCDTVLTSKDLDLVSVIVPVVAVIIHRLIESAYDPQSTLVILKKLTTVAYNTHNIVLALVADSVAVCPSVYLPHLLEFCEYKNTVLIFIIILTYV